MRFALIVLAAAAASAQLTPPDKFFGHRLGADRALARWDKIVDYYRLLESQSAGRLKVYNLGPSTMGHPFLLLAVSSAPNLSNLEQLRKINASLSDPRGLSEQQAKALAAQGKAIVVQSTGLHATEVASSQMTPELVYDQLSRDDEEARRILDNVISLIIPCFNPDGQVMVTDWYRKYVGTEYEAAGLPWLYHKYVGHDNNRDAFQTNMVESQYAAQILFREWLPQAYVDHHQMGSYGPRIYVPPYAEPIRPHGDPIVWREMSWYGAHIAYKEEEAGLSGVINAAIYSGWGHFGFHWITPFHNIAGMLTESASARLATPLYIHPDQLRGDTRALPDYNSQTTFPNPWSGGWWRQRDIVDRQKVSAWAILDLAARNRETVLWNAYLKARRQTERGAAGKPAAYVIPPIQHDPLTSVKLVNKLLLQGIEIHQTGKAFTTADGMTYPAGSYAVSMAQPKTGLIRYLLGRTFYPDNDWTRNRDGSPIRPYDMATDTMFEFMGVRVDPIDQPPASAAQLTKLAAAVQPSGNVDSGASTWSLDTRLNDAFLAVNLLLDQGASVRRAAGAGPGLRPGDFIVSAPAGLLNTVARQTGVDFHALPAAPAGARDLKRRRVAMHQRYRGGNMDEGWTRFLLEQFRFPYTSLMDPEIRKGNLNANYDVIVLPDDSTAALMGEPAQPAARGAAPRPEPPPVPPEYRSGLGDDGVAALKSFVEKGGTLLTFGGASAFAIEKLGLSVRNAVAGLNTKDFWCPGSTLRMSFTPTHPLAYGMPGEGLAVYFTGNPVFEISSTQKAEQYEVFARYPERDLLQSGWLVGESRIARRGAAVAAAFGKGRVILIGFRPQHRAQTHGTFKLVFNALL